MTSRPNYPSAGHDARRSSNWIGLEAPGRELMRIVWFTVMFVGFLASLSAQVPDASYPDTPMTRLRPIGEPSAVDRWNLNQGMSTRQFGRPDADVIWQSQGINEFPVAARDSTGSQRYTVQAQFQMPNPPGSVSSSDASVMPPPSLGPSVSPGGPSVLGPSSLPAPPTSSSLNTVPSWSRPVGPTATTPRSLPTSPAPMTQVPLSTLPSSSDLVPMASPQLNDQFATIDNCSCVTGPSSYVAAAGWTQCTPTTAYVANPAPSSYVVSPATVTPTSPTAIAAPAVIPDASSMPRGSGVPRHALINLGQNRNPVVVGQGIIGQPVAYVPGQWLRNWIRYIFP